MGKKPLPTLDSDEAAERFVDEADLSEYDLSGARPYRFMFRDDLQERIAVSLNRSTVHRAEQVAKSRSEPLEEFLDGLIERALEPSA